MQDLILMKKLLKLIKIQAIYMIMMSIFSWKYPTMRHYCGGYKLLYLDVDDINIEDWWYFARTSKFFVKRTKTLENIFKYK